MLRINITIEGPLKQWQADLVRKAINETDAKRFVPEADMEALFAKWLR